jgi:hypothetical protein
VPYAAEGWCPAVTPVPGIRVDRRAKSAHTGHVYMRKLLGIKPQSDDMLHRQISNKATCSASTMQQVEPRLNLLFQDAQANDSRQESACLSPTGIPGNVDRLRALLVPRAWASMIG